MNYNINISIYYFSNIVIVSCNIVVVIVGYINVVGVLYLGYAVERGISFLFDPLFIFAVDVPRGTKSNRQVEMDNACKKLMS